MKRWKKEEKKEQGEHLKRDDESEGMTTNGMEGSDNNSWNGY